MMAYTLLPATKAEIPDLITVYDAAFKDHPFVEQFMPNADPGAKLKCDLAWYGHEFEIGETDTRQRYLKAVDEGVKVVGFANWQYPYTPTPAEKAEEDAYTERMEEEYPLPDGANKKLYDHFFGELEKMRAKWMDTEKDFFLRILTVDAAHQRRGIGSMLIETGLRDADNAGAKTYIEASPVGLGLYRRHGWTEVDRVSMDMGVFAPGSGMGVEDEVILVREPRVRECVN